MAKLLRRQRRGLLALTVLGVVMALLAVFHRGVPAAQLQLNDGGVWVTNQAKQLIAHLNYPSRTLDAGSYAASATFDIGQHANTVIVADSGTGTVQNLDTASVTLEDGAALGSSLRLSQGGDVAAVTDEKAGKVWVLDAADIGSFSADAEPTLGEVVGAKTVVGADGVVHVVVPEGTLRRIAGGKVSGDGRIEGLSDLSTADLTAVGDVTVVLDKASSMVRTPKGSVPVTSPEKLVLQQPGPVNDRVLLAGPDQYLWAPLGGGAATVAANAAGAGTPAAPVYLDSCAYLAWGGSGAYVRDCANDADDLRRNVEKIKASSQLAFRVNRSVVVLNDLAAGTVWLVNADMLVVDNWDQIDAAAKEQNEKQSETTATTDEPTFQAKREQKTTPEAKDDEYGVRAGRTVTLPVLENDTDADGDLLTASVKTQPTGATVAQVRGGEALSIAVPADASGSYTFTYTVDDGRGGTADANVSLKVYPGSINEAPVQKRTPSVTLGAKGTVSYALLGDFRDPESDSIFLARVVEQPEGLSVKVRPDGVVTVADLGKGGTGQRKVQVAVSDGGKQTTGVVLVNVKDGDVAPVANADHAMALKNTEVVVEPLANDVDPNGDGLALTSVAEAAAGQKIVPDYATGTFRFSCTTPGTYYVNYSIANQSSTTADGWVRVDVAEPVQGDPVAADDLAMLPAGGTVSVDPLGNDTDPSGGVLVLKSVEVPPDAGMAVEIVDHATLRVSAPAGLDAPTDVTYVVSNGTGQATGRVTVLPLPPPTGAVFPNAVDDKAVVRLGDIVSVPVLANDESPAGLPLTLDPKATIEGDAAAGDAFVSRSVVRFRAKKTGTVRVNYTAVDSSGNFATAQIAITVTGVDAEHNRPPLPVPATGRVLAGSTIRIPVGLDGIDPDGDSTTLLGLASSGNGLAAAPTKGTVSVTPDAIEYSAPASAVGTDTFAYEVADRFGAKATASVRVGIAAPNTSNQSPVAVPDDVSTRPGRSLTVNAVANDTDPDGDTLSLVADSVAPTDDQTKVAATASDGLVNLVTPAEETTLRYYYGVSDGHGVPGKGVVSVRVSKDAALKPPVAVDDTVTTAQIKDAKSVVVDVLANDYDPDGSVKDLKLTTEDAGASAAGGTITVTLTDSRQVILYSITDPDGNVGRAAIVVPAADSAAPYLDPSKLPLKVKADELLTIPLADVVIVRAGHAPLLTYSTTVKAGAGADPATAPIKDDKTLQFKATPEFVGLSSLTFEVTDGANRDDPDGRKATLSMPIEVEAAAAVKHPPVFTPSEVTVEAGQSTSVDLKTMVKDEDPGDLDRLTFSAGAASAPFSASLNGSSLVVSAPSTAQPGVTGSADITVTDTTTPAVSKALKLKVTASTRPLIAITTAVVNDAKAGSPSTVDLSKHITNPFADQGPVTIVGQPTVAGTDGAKVAVAGLNVTVTPPAGFHGQLTVTYTAQDVTKTAARQVRGTIQLTVRDKPDPPTAVTAETHLSRTVTVSFSPGANNGAPITKFTAYWAGGSKDCGAQTNCLIEGLTNNTQYTFQVTATNVVSESEKSEASASVRPDVKPDPPGAPVGVFGDKEIALTWPAAKSDGSPVTSYTVQITPGGSTQTVTGGTSTVWKGLTNGTNYTFRVQAHNADKDPSDWSPSSQGVVPAGVPFAPAAPSVKKDPVSELDPSATVTWAAPNGNGDADMTYQLTKVGSTEVLYDGPALSAPVSLDVSTTDQRFQVRAKNKAGVGAMSSASNAVRGWKTPGPVSGTLTATATGANNEVTISFSAAEGNGAAPGDMTYHWSAKGQTGSFSGSSGGTVRNASAFPNGENVSVAVYAVSKVNGESSQGTSKSVTVSAYGPPVSPNVSCGASGTSITCSWSGGNANGRHTNFQVSGDWSASDGGAANSHGFGDVGYSATRTLCVQALQDGGASGGKNCHSARTQDPPPPPTVTVSRGASAVGQPGCGSSSCAYFVVTTANFGGNVSCSIRDAVYGKWVDDWVQGPNERKQLTSYFGQPGKNVTATCGGVSGSVAW